MSKGFFIADTNTHQMTVGDGVFKLYDKVDGLMKVVTFKNGTKEVSMEKSPVPKGTPIVVANYAGPKMLNVDIEAGAQRWNGTKSMHWLRKALRIVGFDDKLIDTMFRKLKDAGPNTSVGRCWG
jgi:hypothetical protein